MICLPPAIDTPIERGLYVGLMTFFLMYGVRMTYYMIVGLALDVLHAWRMWKCLR